MAQSPSSFYISLTNDGSGNFTPTAARGGTAPSGGTALTIPWVESNASGNSSGPGVTTTLLPGVAIQAALRAIVDDIANGH